MVDPDAEAMQGSPVYKTFAKVVQYAEYYKGVRSVYSKGQEVTGQIVLPPHNVSALENTVCNPLAIDNFVQVAGIHANILSKCGNNEVFICTKVDRIQLGKQADPNTRSWIVYSKFDRISNKEIVYDIFVFDSAGKGLYLIGLGPRFTKVLTSSLAMVLSRANGGQGDTANAPAVPVRVVSEEKLMLLDSTTLEPRTGTEIEPGFGSVVDIDINFRRLLNNVTDIPVEALNGESTFEELGIDSLMVTEVLGEIRKVFDVDIPPDDFQNLLDVKSICQYLLSKGGSSRVSLTPKLTSSSPTSLMSSNSESVATRAVSNDVAFLHNATLGPVNLSQGSDSLLKVELSSGIKKPFVADINISQLDAESTFGGLSDTASSQKPSAHAAKADIQSIPYSPTVALQTSASLAKILSSSSESHSDFIVHAQQAFEQIRYDYDIFTKQTGFANFWKEVYPTQARLVLAYVVETFATLGCSLASLAHGESVPLVQFLPKHSLLMCQLKKILNDASLVSFNGADMVRSDMSTDNTPAIAIYEDILRKFPQHASEHKLLHIMGSKLAEFLIGAADPLQILFRIKENKEFLEDVYANGPMYKAVTELLASFLTKAFRSPPSGGKFHILELGAGTGGTTKYIVDFLVCLGIPFSYTFTDLSAYLVANARHNFAGRSFMEFMVLGIEKTPPESFGNRFHTIISTNCIHATRNIAVSMTHIHQMLRPDGFVSLVEFTKNMFWFDLVFGVLEGWWLFEDGREHVLADEWFWENSMKTAGFKHVTWTDGSSEEARTLRIICGFLTNPENAMFKPTKIVDEPEIFMETVIYKQVGQMSLCADIYYPSEAFQSKRPIGTAFSDP
jgi:acyl carrier protein/SAM-dependent methyltransferase